MDKNMDKTLTLLLAS